MKTLVLLVFQILFTANICSQWTYDTTLPYNTTYPPLPARLSVVDSTVCWVLCYTHVNPHPLYPCFINRTASGWKMITDIGLDSIIHARSIYAKDSNTAWLGTGWPEEIYFTSNGGTNWLLQYHLSDTAYVREIMFSKKYPEIGYAFGDLAYGGTWHGARILRTSNGGLNWTKWEFEFNDIMPAENSMAVIDSNCAWFGLNNIWSTQSKVIMTSTSGTTWNIYTVNGGFSGPTGIQFSSDKLTGLYGAPDDVSYIYRTTNSGINWTQIYFINNYSYFNTLRWITETCNIYANTSDYVLRSVNNGLNWSYMTGINSAQLISMDAVKINPGTIYAMIVSNTRKVYKLLDTVRPIGIENPVKSIPMKYELYQNYPNPFNPVTIIKFGLPENNQVTIKIYDVLGRIIDVIINDEFRKAGAYSIVWDASRFPSGIYFCRLEAGGFVSSKKMILIK